MGVTPAGEVRGLNGLLTGCYISLHTGDPTGGNEVVGGAYARQSYVYSLSGGDPTTAANSGVIQFPAATADWGTISHFAIWTASSAGTMVAKDALDSAKAIAIDDVARFLAGQLKVTFS